MGANQPAVAAAKPSRNVSAQAGWGPGLRPALGPASQPSRPALQLAPCSQVPEKLRRGRGQLTLPGTQVLSARSVPSQTQTLSTLLTVSSRGKLRPSNTLVEAGAAAVPSKMDFLG